MRSSRAHRLSRAGTRPRVAATAFAIGAWGLASFTLGACGASPRVTASTSERGGAPSAPALAWLDGVARSCALAASCAHAHDEPRFVDPAACVDAWITRDARDSRPDARRDCLLAARTCDAVDACTRERGDARAAAFCAAHAGMMTGCDGDRFVTCTGDDVGESTAIDCAPLGARCGERSLPGGLLLRGCFSATLCPAGAPNARCEGTAATLSCHDGAVERFACPRGARCEEHQDADGERTASCESPGFDRCEQPGARRCAGDRLVTCEPRGHFGEVRVTDCAGVGLRCAGGAEASCVAPRVECAPGAPRCEGEAIAFCAAGERVRVSCASIGLGPCDPDARGAVAACRVRAR